MNIFCATSAGCRSAVLVLVGLVSACAAVAGSPQTRPAPLVDAAEAGRIADVRQLILAGADVEAAQPDGMTALHWAVHHDDISLAKLLLEHGAQATATNLYGVAPLSIACRNGNADITKLLLAAGADANTTLPGGGTALMTAARTGRVEVVQALLRAGADVNRTEHRSQTALMWAAAEGHVDVVRALLDGGAEQTTLKSGFTPFLFAARNGRAQVVREFLQRGADVSEVMKPERTGGRAPRRGTSALMLAVENGHFELALELVDAGADPNDQRSGFTPLHALTWVRKPDRGDGPSGDPAPRGSGSVDSLQFVRELVRRGADVNVRLKRGKSGRGVLNLTQATPFLMASMTADVPLLRLLLELRADPHLTNADGSTSLMAAAGLGTLATQEVAGTEPEAVAAVQLILGCGADVNAVDANGETAMHGAAYKSFPAVVRVLADNGADITVWNKKNKYGWTPLLIAEGHRPGNFRPSFETVAAIHAVMRENGVTPPPATPRKERRGYQKR